MIEFLFNKTPLYFLIQSFWRDEAFTYVMSSLPFLEIIKKTAQDFNPPFYYVLVHYWMMLFGSSEVSLRAISMFSFIFTVFFCVLILEFILKIKGKRLWLYALIIFLNPFLLYYAFEARMYSLLAFLSTASFYYLLSKDYKKYFIFTFLGFYTHYFFCFVFLIQIIYLLIFEKKYFFENIKKIFYVFLSFVPWLIYVIPKLLNSTSSFWMSKQTVSDLLSGLGVMFTGYENIYGFYNDKIYFLSLVLFVIIALFIFLNKKKDKYFYLFIFWSIPIYFLVLLISFIKPIYVPRYLIFCVVGFNLLLIYIIENFNFNKFIKIAIIFLILYFSITYNSLQTLHKRKGDFRGTMNKIKKLISKNDYLYISNPESYFLGVYYLNEKQTFIYAKNIEEVPKFVGLVLFSKNKFINTIPNYPQKAFILVNDYYYEIQSKR